MTTQCGCDCPKNGLTLPNNSNSIYPGNVVVLGRFSTVRWKVNYGWFKFGGNREICGWSFSREDDPTIIKPIQETDLYDIYIIEA